MREIEVGYATAVRELIDKQATDDGLWFAAVTASEAYLQQELRKLHALAEKLSDRVLDSS